jgi:hypothetical protein
VKSSEEIMEILEAFDLIGSYRAAAELAGCDHHTVRRYVEQRAAGRAPERMHAAQLSHRRPGIGPRHSLRPGIPRGLQRVWSACCWVGT